MKFTVNHIPMDTKWAMTAKGLTGVMAAHLNALYNAVGKEEYSKIITQIWAQMGRGVAEEIRSLGWNVDHAGAVGEAGVTFCMCSMGPEYKIEAVETSEDRAVMKITECPWKNRMNEADIPHDLLTACDTAFWKHFVKNLNPNVTMRHGKQMHRGDPYCEWIFETRKVTQD